MLALLFLQLSLASPPSEIILQTCDEDSLRAAIVQGGIVRIGCDGVIPLTTEILVRKDLLLTAEGRSVTISGQDQTRLFNLSNVTAEFRNITFANGHHQGTHARFITNDSVLESVAQDGFGGALVITNSTATFVTCTFRMNRAEGGHGALHTYTDGTTLLSPSRFGYGGAVFSQDSSLSFAGCTLSSNEVQAGRSAAASFGWGWTSGGAIHASGGSIEISDSLFKANQANTTSDGEGAGGALFLAAPGTITRSVFVGNVVLCEMGASGGAIQCDSSLTIHQSLFRSNLAHAPFGLARGGAIYNSENSDFPYFTVTRSTFISNKAQSGFIGHFLGDYFAAGQGGALYLNSVFVVGNSTFAFNLATGDSRAAHGLGGAIYVHTAALGVIKSSTIVSNTAGPATGSPGEGSGGGLFTEANPPSESLLRGVIFSGNNPANVQGPGTTAAITDYGGNLSSDSSVEFSHPTSATSIDPRLGDLLELPPYYAFFPLLPDSPAIDRLTNNLPETDLLGFSRSLFPPADSGAIEFLGTEPRLHIYLDAGNLTLQLIAPDYRPYTLEQSSDLISWEAISTLTQEPFTLTTTAPFHFFRALPTQ